MSDELYYSTFTTDWVGGPNVKALWNGELVSTSGTHLGHINRNLWDSMGDRYIVNLMSLSGIQSDVGNATTAEDYGKEFRNTNSCFNRRLCP